MRTHIFFLSPEGLAAAWKLSLPTGNGVSMSAGSAAVSLCPGAAARDTWYELARQTGTRASAGGG